VIQVQPHGSKNPIVLYLEMWLQRLKVAACQQDAFFSHLVTVQLVRSPSWNMKLSLGMSNEVLVGTPRACTRIYEVRTFLEKVSCSRTET